MEALLGDSLSLESAFFGGGSCFIFGLGFESPSLHKYAKKCPVESLEKTL